MRVMPGKLVLMFISFIIGGFTGVIITGLMVAAKRGDEQGLKSKEEQQPDQIDLIRKLERKEDNQIVYRCKAGCIKECGNMCCKLCLGATDCNWACELDPSECNQSIIINKTCGIG